jgi:hypothetical protein
MAQTTNAISFKDAKIELSTNGSVWTDASGFSNKVEVGGGERAFGEFFTADGDTPILTVGKRSSFELRGNVVYTEAGGEPWDMVYNAYAGATVLYMRWSPKGGQTGELQFTTGPGYVLTPVLPQGDASTPDVLALEFTLRTLSIAKATVP